MWQGSSWRTRKARQWLVIPHLCVDKPGGTTGEWDRLHNPGFQHGKRKPQNFWLQTPMGVVAVGETHKAEGCSYWKFSCFVYFIDYGPRGLERPTGGLVCTQIHPLKNQHQECPICLWVAGEVTETWVRVQQAPLFPLWPLPHKTTMWVALVNT